MNVPPGSVPVVLLASVDPVLRDTAAGSLVCDAPGAVVVRHDLGRDGLRRLVYGHDGVLEDATLPLEHSCLSCALREDVLPTLERLALGPAGASRDASGAAALVLALPVTAEPLPVLRALAAGHGTGSALRVGAVVSALDGDSAVEDLLGEDLLDDRGLALTDDDRRCVGEALAHQVELADTLLLPRPAPPAAEALLEHLALPRARRSLLHRTDVLELTGRPAVPASSTADGPGRDEELLRRGDLRRLPVPSAPPRDGVWTLDLSSWRPMHPGRLLEHLEVLGAGPLRGRGCLWLPTRPDVVIGWDGAGGQLSIGDIGSWRHPFATLTSPHRPQRQQPASRLLVTGLHHDPGPVSSAFGQALLTDRELARGLAWWQGRDDGFDPWLGAQQDAA